VDRATFQRFYEDTAAALRAYLRLRCRDAALADDLLQDAYLRLLRQALPPLDAVQLKSYLYKTAHSVLADHYRTARREARLRGNAGWRGDAGWHGNACWRGDADSAPPSSSMDDDEPTAAAPLSCAGTLPARDDGPAPGPTDLPVDMQRVFDALKPRQQTLLWLAYVEGFRHDEIASVMGVTVGSVKVLLSRARAELAAALTDRNLAPTGTRRVKA
jgi:RNA polymerase sigma-70 factor (ECF subfamily)